MRQVVHRLTFPLGGEMHIDHQLIIIIIIIIKSFIYTRLVIQPTFGRAVMVTFTVPIDTTEWTEITLEFRILSTK